MDSLVLQVFFLEGLLHLEVGLSFTLDSLLFVVANYTGVHGLQDFIKMYVLLYGCEI